MNKTRTAGDGMESDESTSERVERVDLKVNVNRKDSLLLGRLVQVYPTNIIRSEKRKSINMKTPKFVPYEPYAGAVKPITPTPVQKGSKKSRNNMDINTLITQMSQMDTNLSEFKPRSKLNSTSDKTCGETDKPSAEKDEMQSKIDLLTQENKVLREQLKQQVQVSFELFVI